MEAASGQDQASARFDGVAAQVDAASAADSVASLMFDTIAAVAVSATASDCAASYIGVVNLAGESLNAVAVQDATSMGQCTVTETASAAVDLAAIRLYIGWGRDSVSHGICNGDNFRRRDRMRSSARPWRQIKRQPGR